MSSPASSTRSLRSVIVAHLDLDAFFAAVEELEAPELRRKPLVVGGDPHGRGVVATANYEARRFGIHSAMSAAEALRRCPNAVFLRPRHHLYREYSKAVWSTVRGVVPTVERTGLDEGYLDVGEVACDFLEARKIAEAVQAAVRAATELTCSLGVASSKVVAKIASDRRKPGGLTVVPAGRERAFLASFDVRLLPGVGPRSEERLRAAGVTTIGALAALPDADLRRLLPGKLGPLLRDRARGIDPRPLDLSSERVSYSQEETFERDVADRERRPAGRAPARRGRRLESRAVPAADARVTVDPRERRLDEAEVDPDPLRQFSRWFEEAGEAGIRAPEAMAAATATRDGRPSVRMVLLKGFDERGFVFYTGYESRKGQELAENPRAALLFYWDPLGRQVRIEGPVERIDEVESEAYFRSRPRGARISASVSPQSRVVESRAVLEERAAELEARGGEVPRPPTWGGLRVIPESYEFWQPRATRLPARLRYRRADGGWIVERLTPLRAPAPQGEGGPFRD